MSIELDHVGGLLLIAGATVNRSGVAHLNVRAIS